MQIQEQTGRISLGDGENEIAASVEGEFVVIVVENPFAESEDGETGGVSAITLTREAAATLGRWLLKAALPG